MQHNFKQVVEAQMEAQRFNASYAARPALTPAQRAQAEYHAMKAAIAADDLESAKAHARALRPLLGFMPEGE